MALDHMRPAAQNIPAQLKIASCRGTHANLADLVTRHLLAPFLGLNMPPSPGPLRHALTLRIDLSEVKRARELASHVGAGAGFCEEKCFDIQVACSEACANAIEHSPSETEVEVEILLYHDRLEVKVEGPGQFELPAVAAQDRTHRGLGLPLMAKLSDHLALYSGPRGGTLVALTFYRPGFGDEHPNDVTPPSVAELLEENQLVASILGSIPDEVWFVDTEKRSTLVSAAAFAESGFVPGEEADAQELATAGEEYHPDMRSRPPEEAPALRALAGEVIRNQEEVVRARASGQLRHRLVNAAPVRDASGGIIGAVSVVRDITELKRAEELLRQGETDLERAQELAQAGSWRLDTRRNELTWSDEAYRIFGVPPGTSLTYESFLSFVHPEDRAGVNERWAAALKGEPYDIEHRVIVGDDVKWVHEKAELELDAHGVLLGGFGSVQDITERRRAEEALRESEERFRTLADSIPQLAWMANADGYITWYNQRWYEYTGTTPSEMEGWGWQKVHDPQVLPAVLERWQASIASGEPVDMEFPLRGADGVLRPFLTRATPQKDASGRVVRWFGTNTDITERKRAEEARRRREESLARVLSTAGRLRIFDRRATWLVFVIGAVVQGALFFGVDQLGSPSRYLGIPGAATALIGVVAAIVAGPLAGMAVALVGGAAYFAFITDFGASVAWPAIVISILLWILAAAVAGLAGDWVRRSAVHREDLLSHMLDERRSLADSLRAANAGLQAQNEELAAREDELHAQAEELVAQHELLQDAHTETARLLEEKSSLFLRLQGSLLDIPEELSGVTFGHLYRSATQQAQVGGDFYDIFEAKGGRIALLIGDVCGHGLEAARIATLAKDICHAFAHQFRRPHLVLREANRLLVEKNLSGFVSVFLGFLDPQTGALMFSSAGHPPPLLAMDGQVAPLECIGLPLGVFADARYRDSETQLKKESLLLLYTDGVTEARRDGEIYGEKRLADAFGRLQGLPVDRLPARLLDEALHFSGGFLRDDAALLIVNYPGDRSQPVVDTPRAR